MPDKAISLDRLGDYDKKLKELASLWQKLNPYSLEDIIQYKGYYLKCTTAGTSGSITLDMSNVSVGDTINDGTCVWTVVENGRYATSQQIQSLFV